MDGVGVNINGDMDIAVLVFLIVVSKCIFDGTAYLFACWVKNFDVFDNNDASEKRSNAFDDGCCWYDMEVCLLRFWNEVGKVVGMGMA